MSITIVLVVVPRCAVATFVDFVACHAIAIIGDFVARCAVAIIVVVVNVVVCCAFDCIGKGIRVWGGRGDKKVIIAGNGIVKVLS